MIDKFRMAFFGSSNFVQPILQDILDSSGLTLAQKALVQLDNLFQIQESFVSILPAGFADRVQIEKLKKNILNQSELNKFIEVTFVVTQPAHENRGKQILNPVFEYAQKMNLPIFAPHKIKTELDEFEVLANNLDLGVVASYGQILPRAVLDSPKFGLINWHPSSLPKYRGPTPMQTALANGDEWVGLSWIEVGAGMDSGPVLLQLNSLAKSNQDIFDLADQMGHTGVQTWALAAALQILNRQKIELSLELQPIIQDESQVVFCKMLSKLDKIVDRNTWTADQIYNHWRAYRMFPGTSLTDEFFGGEIKLISCQGVLNQDQLEAKEIQETQTKGNWRKIKASGEWQTLLLAGDGNFIIVEEIGLENGKRIQFKGFNF